MSTMTTINGYLRETLFHGVARDDDTDKPVVYQIHLVHCLDGLTVGILHQRMGDTEEHVDDVLTLDDEGEAHDMFFEHWAILQDDDDVVCGFTAGPPPDIAGQIRRHARGLAEMLRDAGAPEELLDALARETESVVSHRMDGRSMTPEEVGFGENHDNETRQYGTGDGYGMYL